MSALADESDDSSEAIMSSEDIAVLVLNEMAMVRDRDIVDLSPYQISSDFNNPKFISTLNTEITCFNTSDSAFVSTHDVLAYWEQHFQTGDLRCSHFREWWRRKVPLLMGPIPSMNFQQPTGHFDESLILQQLIEPLERFICGNALKNDQNWNQFQHLRELNDVPSKCGKMFKISEPTYSCRDCCNDQTCVLCVNCFKNSQHRYHRYKMNSSSGGGYCDCGDLEAWKSDPHCSIHQQGLSTVACASSSSMGVPAEIIDRAKCVFLAVLRYVYDMLTAETLMTLPADLSFAEGNTSSAADGDNNYATIIYNDEIHSFDEVIQALPRAIDCDRTAAIALATLIDREGRCLVKCGPFQVCAEVRRITERVTSRRGNRPLKVVIMNSKIVSHQTFAVRLVTWLQDIMSISCDFRHIFADVAMSSQCHNPSLIEGFLRHDTIMWKMSRHHLHHLFATGLLLDAQSRQTFGRIFNECYAHMMKSFIADDHDHSFSVTSLSVQLFTVPSVAMFLIGEHDVMANILRTFMSQCSKKKNNKGKFDLKSNQSNIHGNHAEFKRTVHILLDLVHLLRTPPMAKDWNNGLRKGFLHGFSLFLDIFSWMQGMDEQTRQVSNHLEYELEWESGFNLHMRLAPAFSLLIKWCATDKSVYIKSIRALLKTIWNDQAHLINCMSVQNVADHEANCVIFDVASKAVSIHLPLTRMLAGLSLSLGLHNLRFDSNELCIQERCPVSVLMEPSLRTLVLMGQVQAGMWRRNGYSLVDQARIYHDPRCRMEMLDLDVIMLQFAATLSNPDEFVINILHKFNLIPWSNISFDCGEEDNIRQVISLVEEFFGIMITIVGERYTPGLGHVSKDDQIRKEVIQMLCVEPMSHSALSKMYPDDARMEADLERILLQVADFKKPSMSPSTALATVGKGLYHLKPEFYDQYDAFYYHYTREEQSKSEEAQRLRGRSTNTTEYDALPPPCPPAFTNIFSKVIDIMQCDVFLYILWLVLHRADNLLTRCFSECQVHRVLYLVGLCLHEEERANIVHGLQQTYFQFTKRADSQHSLFKCLKQLVGSQRIESHKNLLAWTLRKWQNIVNQYNIIDDVETTSKWLSNETTLPVTLEDADGAKKRKAEAANARRLKILDNMKLAQSKFVALNANMFESESVVTELTETQNHTIPITHNDYIAVGHNRSCAPTSFITTFTCILCQEHDKLSSDGKNALVMAAYIQKSTVHAQKGGDRKSCEDFLSAVSTNVNSSSSLVHMLLPSDMSASIYSSSCGHIMHVECWKKYFDDILNLERQRSRIRHPAGFDVDRHEFLCPLCRSLSNVVMPLIPRFHTLQPAIASPNEHGTIDYSHWLQAICLIVTYKKIDNKLILANSIEASNTDVELEDGRLKFHQALERLENLFNDDVSNVKSFAQYFVQYSENALHFSSTLFESMNIFSQTAYRIAFDQMPAHHDELIPLMVWQTCAYTIHSNVWCLSERKRPLFCPNSVRQNEFLASLVRVCGIVGSNFGEPSVIRNQAFKLFFILLDIESSNVNMLDVDPFGLLVNITFALPSLFNSDYPAPLPSSGLHDGYCLRLIFLFHITQILLTNKEFHNFDVSEVEEHNFDSLNELFQIVHGVSPSAPLSHIWSHLQQASLHFLKCAAMFFHFLSDVVPPLNLQTENESSVSRQFNDLMAYLGMRNDPATLLDVNSPLLSALVRSWVNYLPVNEVLPVWPSMPCQVRVKYPLCINRLVPLPNDYSDLINSVSAFSCLQGGLCDDSRVPAMCLICGKVLCSQSYCCQESVGGVMVGACIAHSHHCGLGVGMFLRIRDCKVVLLSTRNKGCYVTAPYLDQYGETDIMLRRGNPLSLCVQQYNKLYRLWLNHGIQEEIARNLESNVLLLATPWQHF